MTERVVFNFFDSNETMLALCKHFNLDESIVDRFIQQADTKNGQNSNTYFRCFDFVSQFNLPVDKIDTENIFITAKHITTLSDNSSTLKKYGLLNLKDVLEKETPLRQFLEQRGIKFDVNRNKIKVLDAELDLFRCNNICKSCSTDRNKVSSQKIGVEQMEKSG